MKKINNISKIVLVLQVVILLLTVFLSYANKTYCDKDEYGVVTMSSPLSVRIQDESQSGIRVEREIAIVDSPRGLLVGRDARFMGDIFVGEEIGKSVLVDYGSASLIFKNGILIEVIDTKEDK